MANKLDPKVAEAVMLKAGLKPLEPYTNTITKWKCKCLKCKAIVFPLAKQIIRGQGGCKTCRSLDLSERFRMPEKDAVKVMLANNLKPLEPYVNSHKEWLCLCLKCGKKTKAILQNIKRQGSCVYCSRRKVDAEDAVVIMREKGYEPISSFKDAKTEWKSKCLLCGKVSFPVFSDIQSRKNITGCKYCNIRAMDEKQLIKFMLKQNLKPLEPYVNARTAWKCLCLKCGNVVTPTYDNVRVGKGCNFCSPLGINLNIPSYLYLITNPLLNSHKVGIGNVRPTKRIREDRLGKFNKSGWNTYKVWNFETGGQALDIEKKVFKVIRKDLKLPIYLSKEQMPKTEGQSETVDADSITLLELEKIINKVIKEYK